jgi:hypothetical protein
MVNRQLSDEDFIAWANDQAWLMRGSRSDKLNTNGTS